jgi:hypothetical protein
MSSILSFRKKKTQKQFLKKENKSPNHILGAGHRTTGKREISPLQKMKESGITAIRMRLFVFWRY